MSLLVNLFGEEINTDVAMFKFENGISASSMIYAFIAAPATHQGNKSVNTVSYLFQKEKAHDIFWRIEMSLYEMYVREKIYIVNCVFDFTQEMYAQITHPFIQKPFNFTFLH